MDEAIESIVVRPGEGSVIDTRYWHVLEDGRVQCDVCPRACKLRDGQRGLCFVRGAEAGRIKLFSYGRSSGCSSGWVASQCFVESRFRTSAAAEGFLYRCGSFSLFAAMVFLMIFMQGIE